jgi:hypothetical protein
MFVLRSFSHLEKHKIKHISTKKKDKVFLISLSSLMSLTNSIMYIKLANNSKLFKTICLKYSLIRDSNSVSDVLIEFET